jgi:hypothetical protein
MDTSQEEGFLLASVTARDANDTRRARAGEEVLLSLTATAADGAPLAAWAHERVTLGGGFLSRRVEDLITAHMPPGSVCPPSPPVLTGHVSSLPPY